MAIAGKAVPSGTMSGASILLVDDNHENLVALEATLEPLGHRLVWARSGREALKCLLTEDFALVLLDVQMPSMDGFETAGWIKQRGKTRDLPIIFITAINKDLDHVFRGYDVGAVDYLFKPFDQEVLRSKVSVFIDLHLKSLALNESEERFRRAFEDAPIGMGLFDAEGRWLRVNCELSRIAGRPESELLRQTFEDLIHPQDRGDDGHLRQLLAGETRRLQMEKRCRRSDGSIVWVVISVSAVRGAEGEPLYVIAQVENISERKRVQAELAHQAMHDSLTGLANRALFIDRLELALARRERSESLVAVLFLDLDRFKVINDSFGHDCGDELLQGVGRRLTGLVRPSDTVARMGGDEFTILCEDANPHHAIAIAERIQKTLAAPFELGGSEVFVKVSIGIVLADGSCASAADLIRDADAAMYRAKENGKARYELFDDRMRAQTMERVAMENALYRAFERSELRVFYQPEVELATGAVTGVEALVRWQHPERGLVAPREFISLAEDTGLIIQLDTWVLKEACGQAQRWRACDPGAPPLKIAVNLSARSFTQPDVVEVVAGVLADTNTDPSLLCLEITETMLMEDSEHTLKMLADFKRLGVMLSMDDFGTGYSSLSYLKRFAVDSLKVDRSFVEGLRRDPDNFSILGAVVGLADALGLNTVAEGVETTEQLEDVRALRFTFAQGYHFARPQPAEAVAPMLAQRSIGSAVPVDVCGSS